MELYRPGLGLGNFASRTIRFLDQLVPSEFVVFGSLDTATQNLDLGLNESVPQFPAAMEAFGELMRKYPLYCWDPGVNDGKPFTRSDFFSKRQFMQTDMFAEVYKLLGIDDHCAVWIPDTPGEVCFYGIERLRGKDYSMEERVMLELAQQHLSNARQLAQTRNRIGHRGARPEALARRGLTPREAEVLTWLAEGKSNEEIAILLQLQLYTVKGYVKTIFQKIGAPNRLAAALWALRVTMEDEERTESDAAQVVRLQGPSAA